MKAGLLLGLILAGCGAGHQQCGPKDEAQLAAIIAGCTARVQLECAGPGLPPSQCAALKECDDMIDDWGSRCE